MTHDGPRVHEPDLVAKMEVDAFLVARNYRSESHRDLGLASTWSYLADSGLRRARSWRGRRAEAVQGRLALEVGAVPPQLSRRIKLVNPAHALF